MGNSGRPDPPAAAPSAGRPETLGLTQRVYSVYLIPAVNPYLFRRRSVAHYERGCRVRTGGFGMRRRLVGVVAVVIASAALLPAAGPVFAADAPAEMALTIEQHRF